MKFYYLLFTFFLTFISSFSQTYSQPDTLWTRSYGTTKNGEESGRYVEQTSDGGYIVTGFLGSIDMSIPKWYTDLWLIKMNEYGDTIWTKTYDRDVVDIGQMVNQTDDGGYITLGANKLYPPQLYLMKLAPDSILMSVNIDESIPGRFHLSQNYPNPFNPTTTIKYQIPELSFVTIKVYNVLGGEIATLVNEEKPVGSYEVEFNASTIASGIYFYQLKAGVFVATKKMVLMK